MTASNLTAAYIAFDVDRIKEFVFAGHRPLDATGASELVKSLDKGLRHWLTDFGNPHILYAQGGGGLIRLEDGSLAEAAKEVIESEYRRATLTGSCSAVWIPCPAGGYTGQDFRNMIRLLGIRLQRRKAEKAGECPAEAWTMGYYQTCQGCGLAPSQHLDKKIPEKEEWLCASCNRKREHARDEHADSKMARSMQDLSRRTKRGQKLNSGQEDESGYVACFYADVDRAGKLLQMCESEQQATLFSEHLFNCMEQGLDIVRKDPDYNGHYQSPIVGGDDLVLFLPAKRCVQTTEQIWKTIEAEIKRVPPGLKGSRVGTCLANEVSLSIGLLTASDHLPIPFLFDMAMALLKSAKTCSYRTNESAIDYMLLKGGSPLSDDIGAAREQHFRLDATKNAQFPQANGTVFVKRTHLTRRPYTHQTFSSLLQIEKNLLAGKSEAKSALRSILEAIQTMSPMEALLHTRYQEARNNTLKSYSSPSTLHDLFQRAEMDKENQVVTTGVLDLLELHEMDTL